MTRTVPVPRRRLLWGRSAGVLRRHWLMVAFVVVGATLRVLTSVAYRPAIIYIDSVAVYLANLLSFNAVTPDPLGYDILLLRPVLAVANLATVAAVQHLIGLAMAIATYVLLVHKGAWRWLAALAAAPILLDAYQVQIEHNVMPDLLFQALLVAGLATLAWQRRPGPWAIVVGGLLLGAAVTVRVVGLPLLLIAVGYVLLTARGARRRAGRAALMALCCALPVISYGGYAQHATGRFSLSGAGGASLYGRVATFADCRGMAMPAYEVPLCPTEPAAQRPGPDYYAHDPRSAIFQVKDTAGLAATDIVTDFSLRVLRHQPADFAYAVARDSVKLFSWQHTDSANPEAPTERWRFQATFPTFPSLVTLDSIAALNRTYGDGPPTVTVALARFLRAYQLTVGYTPGPVLALALLVALVAAGGVGRARRSPVRAAGLLYLTSGVGVLLFADAFEFSWRYQLPGLVSLPVTGALGLVALIRPTPDDDGRDVEQATVDRGIAAAFPEPTDIAALETFRDRYGEVAFPTVVVLIAAYNEAASLGRVLDAIPDTSCGQHIAKLVVVDGGNDTTAQVAIEHGAHTCVAPVNRGQGAALRLGYHLARTGGARFIVTTDADEQYDVAQLPLLLEPLLADEADFVTGSRRLGANASPDLVRRAGTRVFALMVSVLTGHPVTDTSFGFRSMRAEVTAAVTLTQPQYQSSELLIAAISRGFRVVEQPMSMRGRSAGKSKKGNNFTYGLRYARVVLGTWARERAAVKAGAPHTPATGNGLVSTNDGGRTPAGPTGRI